MRKSSDVAGLDVSYQLDTRPEHHGMLELETSLAGIYRKNTATGITQFSFTTDFTNGYIPTNRFAILGYWFIEIF